MTTKTVRSRFDHEIGGKVEGCTILEKRIIIPPQPSERRLGVYDYVVEAPPIAAKPESNGRSASGRKPTARALTRAAAAKDTPPEQGSFTRASPDEIGGGVIRRVPSR